MNAIYYLKNDKSKITFEVQVGTIGNAVTVPTIRRTGGSIIDLQSSIDGSGSIPKSPMGISADLLNSALVVTTMVLFGKADDLDQALNNLSMTVTLHGGLDGDQSYNIVNAEKSAFIDHRCILATKVIKLKDNKIAL